MKRLLAFLALVFFVSIAGATHLAAQNLAITNVRIIVGNGDVIENGSIVARGGKLVSVSRLVLQTLPASRSLMRTA